MLIAKENGKCYFDNYEEAEEYRKNLLDNKISKYFQSVFNLSHEDFTKYIDTVKRDFPNYKNKAMVWYGKHKKSNL